MTHWTEDFYARLDRGDPSVADSWASDIRVQVGNDDPIIGKERVMSGPLGRITGAIKSIRHDVLGRHDVSADRSIIEFLVHYTRHDDALVSIPVVTIIARDAAGLVNDLRLYLDTTPLFAGQFATIRLAGTVPVNRPGDQTRVELDPIWEALVDKAHNATKYVPNISRCVVIDKGVDTDGHDWIRREINVDGMEAEERVVFYPKKRIIFTRTKGEQMGVIHNIVDELDGEMALSFAFDLRWFGMPEGSELAQRVGEEMRQGYARTFATVGDNLRKRATTGMAA